VTSEEWTLKVNDMRRLERAWITMDVGCNIEGLGTVPLVDGPFGNCVRCKRW